MCLAAKPRIYRANKSRLFVKRESISVSGSEEIFLDLNYCKKKLNRTKWFFELCCTKHNLLISFRIKVLKSNVACSWYILGQIKWRYVKRSNNYWQVFCCSYLVLKEKLWPNFFRLLLFLHFYLSVFVIGFVLHVGKEQCTRLILRRLYDRSVSVRPILGKSHKFYLLFLLG